jgi:hypothetical protein
MTLHQPNRRVERARFFEMEDTGDTIRIKREIAELTTLGGQRVLPDHPGGCLL